MINRIALLCATGEQLAEGASFGDLRKLQPLYFPAPLCATSNLQATECVDLLRASISLSLLEKCQFLRCLNQLPKHTIEQLIDVLKQEQIVFRNASPPHQDELLVRELNALIDWWRIERWFWQQGYFEFEPMLFIARADPTLSTNVEFLLKQFDWV